MFDINCAPEMYQQVMHQVLQNCEGVHHIMDDIIIHGASKDEYDVRLKCVLDKIRECGLVLNRDKCVFNMSQLVFMGHVLSAKGIGPTQDKVKAVNEAREPRTAAEVRNFLGLLNFHARFLPDLATVSEPLRKLTRKGTPFQWGPDQKNAFTELKNRLCNADVLGYYDKNAKTQVIADASPYGLAGILLQVQNGEKRVICSASRTLSQVERHYSQTEKEALALVWACERFHVYLYGADFELVTDCKLLEFIFSPRSKPSARIERWVLRQQPYRYRVTHVPGHKNIADSLSRLLVLQKCENAVTNELHDYIMHVAQIATPVSLTAREIERASDLDSELVNLRQCISNANWSDL